VEANLEILPSEVTELIFIVGYLKEQIMNHFGNEFGGRKITYVEQKKQLGTAHAIALAKQHITGRFLVMMGDDIYCKADIEAIINGSGNAILIKKVRSKFSGGHMEFDNAGNLLAITEGTHPKGYINAALYAITPEYFNYEPVAIKGGKEYGLPQTLITMREEYPIRVVEAKWWQQVSDVDDLKRLPKLLRNRPQ
jgi:NDP-sugar pyrophosphorylase family protein